MLLATFFLSQKINFIRSVNDCLYNEAQVMTCNCRKKINGGMMDLALSCTVSSQGIRTSRG